MGVFTRQKWLLRARLPNRERASRRKGAKSNVTLIVAATLRVARYLLIASRLMVIVTFMKKEIIYTVAICVVLQAVWATAASKGNPGSDPPSLPVVTVIASDPNASEDGPDLGAFAVSRTGDTNKDLTVYYSLGGTAFNGKDYKMLPGFVTIPAGTNAATVTVTPLLDVDPVSQASDTVILQLRDMMNLPDGHGPRIPTTYSVGYPSNAVVTIKESTNAPTLPVVTVVATDPKASEDGPDPGVFTVTRKGGTNDPLTVFYSLGGTAHNGTDYQRLPSSVTIPAGALSADVKVVPILDVDLTAETNETVVLQLQALDDLRPDRVSLYSIGYPSNAVVTIAESTNAPPPPPVVTVVATDPKASEDGPDPGVFTVTRTDGTNNDLTVYYSLGGTARNGRDYKMLPGFVTIHAGTNAASVTVTPILDVDTTPETNETVVLQLHPLVDMPPGRVGLYSIGFPSNAVVTIAETTNAPPAPPVVTVVATAPDASEVGPKSGTFTVSRTDGTNSQLTVYYSLGGTAVNGIDYQQLPNSVNIPTGSFTATITVTPILDLDPKPTASNTVVLQLRAPAHFPPNQPGDYTVGSPSNAVVTIMESPNQPTNPVPVVTIVARDPLAIEPGHGHHTNDATLVVRRTDGTNADLVVYYSIGGTASNGVDYVKLPGSVTIPAGLRNAIITITPLTDQSSNFVETVILTVQPPPTSGGSFPTYAIGTPFRATAAIVNQDVPRGRSHSFHGGVFQMGVPVANGSWRVEVSNDLINWQSLGASSVTGGVLQFVDPDTAGDAHRFYRAVPDPTAPPDDD